MPGSCTHISSDTAKDQCKWVHGISKRKEQSFAIPEIWEHEVRILKQRILVSRVGKNTKAIKEYIANQLKADKEADQLALFDPRDPFNGKCKDFQPENTRLWHLIRVKSTFCAN